ncbi:hypothetical protein P5673_003473 [Acropora cervicornis]|uniref:Secreted protein n=1 Tax=Acropora cervicornis TaxID=6130 RepID=A0AAD9VEZ8_ACRCE|nr:hypothetical protein P5673_003473 [Acropora cervicornis]
MYLLYLITAWQALSLLYWEMDYSSVECIVCKLLNSCLVEMKAANEKLEAITAPSGNIWYSSFFSRQPIDNWTILPFEIS